MREEIMPDDLDRRSWTPPGQEPTPRTFPMEPGSIEGETESATPDGPEVSSGAGSDTSTDQ